MLNILFYFCQILETEPSKSDTMEIMHRNTQHEHQQQCPWLLCEVDEVLCCQRRTLEKLRCDLMRAIVACGCSFHRRSASVTVLCFADNVFFKRSAKCCELDRTLRITCSHILIQHMCLCRGFVDSASLLFNHRVCSAELKPGKC